MKVKAYHFTGENESLGNGTTEYLLFLPEGEEEELAEPFPGFEVNTVTDLEVPDDFPLWTGFVRSWSL